MEYCCWILGLFLRLVKTNKAHFQKSLVSSAFDRAWSRVLECFNVQKMAEIGKGIS